jgi:hypothetical protein
MAEICFVPNCNKEADYAVIFYDVYLRGSGTGDVTVFYHPHESCPYICQHHLNENELQAENGLEDEQLRRYRRRMGYPHTQSGGQGFCIYRPLK